MVPHAASHPPVGVYFMDFSASIGGLPAQPLGIIDFKAANTLPIYFCYGCTVIDDGHGNVTGESTLDADGQFELFTPGTPFDIESTVDFDSGVTTGIYSFDALSFVEPAPVDSPEPPMLSMALIGLCLLPLI
jgi:hypothetical protein